MSSSMRSVGPEKIVVMHVLYSFGIGGLEACIAELINRMNPDRFSHHLCLLSDQMACMGKIWKPEGIQCHVVRRRFQHDPTLFLRLCALMMRVRPDIVATYNWGAIEAVIAARLSGIRRVIHSEHGFDIDEIYQQKRRRVLARRLILNACEKVIVVSKQLQNWLIDKVKVEPDRVVFIPNGCDLQRFRKPECQSLRESLNISGTDTVIGAVGTLKELKDPKTLILAFAKVAKSRGGLKLLFVGDGSQRHELEALANREGVSESVIFVGSVQDPAPYFSLMAIYVLASLYENLPMALLEAMAMGLPIIATDVGDVREALGDGEAGLLIRPQDVEGLRNALDQYVIHPEIARKKGKCAASRVVRLYSLATIIRRYEAVYMQTEIELESQERELVS